MKIFSLGSYSWKQATPPGSGAPAPRYGHSAVIYKKQLYVLVGQDSVTDYNDVWALPLKGTYLV